MTSRFVPNATSPYQQQPPLRNNSAPDLSKGLSTNPAGSSKTLAPRPSGLSLAVNNASGPSPLTTSFGEKIAVQNHTKTADENAPIARAEALRKAGRDLGFELPLRHYMPERSDLQGWVEFQTKGYERFVEEEGTRKNQ